MGMANTIPTPALPLKGRELKRVALPLKGREFGRVVFRLSGRERRRVILPLKEAESTMQCAANSSPSRGGWEGMVFLQPLQGRLGGMVFGLLERGRRAGGFVRGGEGD
jgi:hypothetical protein